MVMIAEKFLLGFILFEWFPDSIVIQGFTTGVIVVFLRNITACFKLLIELVVAEKTNKKADLFYPLSRFTTTLHQDKTSPPMRALQYPWVPLFVVISKA